MTIQKDYINNEISKRCEELKKEVMPYIESKLDEMLNQAKEHERILLYGLLDNGSLELPDKGCEAFIRKFILDNEKMVLDTLLVHKAEEFLDRQILKLEKACQ